MLTIDRENREARLMDAVLREGVGSDAGAVSLNPRLAPVAAQIASGRFNDAANLFEKERLSRSEAHRAMSTGTETAQDHQEGRFVYLKRTECDDAVARNRELATRPDDPFVLAKAVAGPWSAPERTIPKFPFTP
jgi:hypothetical protein